MVIAHDSRLTSFEPHLWLKVEREIPRPIFVVAFIGVANLLRVPLPRLFAYEHLHTYFLSHYETLRSVDGGRAVTSYGLCTGYYYHYQHGCTIEFDTTGDEVGRRERVPPHYAARATLTKPELPDSSDSL